MTADMTADMTAPAPRLPDGFAVQVDRRVRVLGDGSALLGGSPTRLLKLAPAAQDMLCDGRLKVRDDVSAQLARTLLDATVAHPRPAGGPSHNDVTVVIPVRDNLSGVRRLVSSLRGLRVVVVDDGSFPPIEPADFVGAHCDVEVLRHSRSRGPAAARNTGLAACTTDYVAFLDSDVAPRRGWLEALLGHFCDPTVALAAPRIVGLSHSENVVARYEAVHSSLDLGEREAPVLPHSTVSYVPSAAIICRCSALRAVGGFDETLQSGEDVDLCWRLIEAGARLRYEPIALVAHDHRTELRDWLARKAFYGGSAAPLSVRHPDKTAPVVISGWALMTWIMMAFGTRLSQLASALCRHYWPLALLAAMASRHFRRVVLVAAIMDGVVDWLRRRDAIGDDAEPIGLLTYLLLKRVDDLAYGLGLWWGVLRERNLRALKPQIRN